MLLLHNKVQQWNNMHITVATCLCRHTNERTQVNCKLTLHKTRPGLKDGGPGAIFTRGPLWRIAWRHSLRDLCFRWFATCSYPRKMLFFLLLMLLFRSVCHQVSNQADKLVFSGDFFLLADIPPTMSFIFCFDLKPGEHNFSKKVKKKVRKKFALK